MFGEMTVTAVTEVMTIPVLRGKETPITDRATWGLTFCERGRIAYTWNGQDYLSDADHAVLLPAGGTYVLHCQAGGRFPLVNFTLADPPPCAFVCLPLRRPAEVLRAYARLRENFLFRGRAEVMSAMYDILGLLGREEQGGADGAGVLAPAIAYLESHYTDPGLTNAEIAAAAHISEVWFRRRFKEVYHTTPRRYLSDIRLKTACRLLQSGTVSVGGVAEACGFSGVYHFSRAFRAAFGCTASEYRHRSKTAAQL